MSDDPICEGCDTEPAVVSLIITNSQSAANVSFSCAACSLTVVHDWLFRPDPGDDIAGWEITKLTRSNARPAVAVVVGGERAAPHNPADCRGIAQVSEYDMHKSRNFRGQP